MRPPYPLPRQAQQLDLLARVLSAGLDEAGIEAIGDADADGLAAAGRPGARRKVRACAYVRVCVRA